MSYPMDENSRQGQSAYMPSAPNGYAEPSVKQPAGGIIQPHVIPYNNTHVQQPPGHTVVVVPPQAHYVNSFTALSVLGCLCCWPIGIFALIMSCMVGSSVREGNIEEARSYSKRAKSLSIAAIICGVIIYILVAVLRGIVLANSDTRTNQQKF